MADRANKRKQRGNVFHNASLDPGRTLATHAKRQKLSDGTTPTYQLSTEQEIRFIAMIRVMFGPIRRRAAKMGFEEYIIDHETVVFTIIPAHRPELFEANDWDGVHEEILKYEAPTFFTNKPAGGVLIVENFWWPPPPPDPPVTPEGSDDEGSDGESEEGSDEESDEDESDGEEPDWEELDGGGSDDDSDDEGDDWDGGPDEPNGSDGNLGGADDNEESLAITVEDDANEDDDIHQDECNLDSLINDIILTADPAQDRLARMENIENQSSSQLDATESMERRIERQMHIELDLLRKKAKKTKKRVFAYSTYRRNNFTMDMTFQEQPEKAAYVTVMSDAHCKQESWYDPKTGRRLTSEEICSRFPFSAILFEAQARRNEKLQPDIMVNYSRPVTQYYHARYGKPSEMGGSVTVANKQVKMFDLHHPSHNGNRAKPEQLIRTAENYRKLHAAGGPPLDEAQFEKTFDRRVRGLNELTVFKRKPLQSTTESDIMNGIDDVELDFPTPEAIADARQRLKDGREKFDSVRASPDFKKASDAWQTELRQMAAACHAQMKEALVQHYKSPTFAKKVDRKLNKQFLKPRTRPPRKWTDARLRVLAALWAGPDVHTAAEIVHALNNHPLFATFPGKLTVDTIRFQVMRLRQRGKLPRVHIKKWGRAQEDALIACMQAKPGKLTPKRVEALQKEPALEGLDMRAISRKLDSLRRAGKLEHARSLEVWTTPRDDALKKSLQESPRLGSAPRAIQLRSDPAFHGLEDYLTEWTVRRRYNELLTRGEVPSVFHRKKSMHWTTKQTHALKQSMLDNPAMPRSERVEQLRSNPAFLAVGDLFNESVMGNKIALLRQNGEVAPSRKQLSITWTPERVAAVRESMERNSNLTQAQQFEQLKKHELFAGIEEFTGKVFRRQVHSLREKGELARGKTLKIEFRWAPAQIEVLKSEMRANPKMQSPELFVRLMNHEAFAQAEGLTAERVGDKMSYLRQDKNNGLASGENFVKWEPPMVRALIDVVNGNSKENRLEQLKRHDAFAGVEGLTTAVVSNQIRRLRKDPTSGIIPSRETLKWTPERTSTLISLVRDDPEMSMADRATALSRLPAFAGVRPDALNGSVVQHKIHRLRDEEKLPRV